MFGSGHVLRRGEYDDVYSSIDQRLFYVFQERVLLILVLVQEQCESHVVFKRFGMTS